MPTWNGPPYRPKFRGGLVESRGRLRRVMPREPPEVAPLVRPEAVAHADDALDLVERCAALAKVADHVPVNGRVVHAAGLGVARAQRQVERAADLLVEQDLLGAGLDPVVRADPELSEAAGAVVGVERLEQQLLAGVGARV